MPESGSAREGSPAVRILMVVASGPLREALQRALSAEAGFRDLGTSGPLRKAPALVRNLRPDLVVLAAGGEGAACLQAIEEIMVAAPSPILVLTDSLEPVFAREAVERGALRVLSADDPLLSADRALAREARVLAGVRVTVHLKGRRRTEETGGAAVSARASNGAAPRGRIVAVASSAGGPQALCALLSALPPSFPAPIVVAQHIAVGFEIGLATWLQSACRLRIRPSAEGERLAPGTVYVGAPAGRNVSVSGARELLLPPVPPEQIYHPSGDLLLTSVAEVAGPESIGVILSGMGSDGVAGLGRIDAAGGATIAQDEKSSLVFGMPRLAIEKGYARTVLPVEAIPAELVRLTGGPGAGSPWT